MLKNVSYQKPKKYHKHYVEKTVIMMFLDCWFLNFFKSLLKKIKKKFLLFLDFSQNPTFWISFSFHQEILGGTNFFMVLCVCIVHAVIVIKKCLVIFLRISFYELSKSTTIIFLNFLYNLKFICHMCCVMCDAWNVMCQAHFWQTRCSRGCPTNILVIN